MIELEAKLLTLTVNGKPLSVSLFKQLPMNGMLPLSKGDKPLGIVKHLMNDEREKLIRGWRGFWVLYLNEKGELHRCGMGTNTKPHHVIRREIQELQDRRDYCLRRAETPASIWMPVDHWPLYDAEKWQELADEITEVIKGKISVWEWIEKEDQELHDVRIKYRDTLPQIFLVD